MRILTLLAILLISSIALAETYTENFDGGSNVGNWEFGGPLDTHHATGGNPDGWIGTMDLDTFAPIFHCESAAPYFTGDYLTMGVTKISGDFRTDASGNEWAYTYNFTVLLRDDGKTPDDPTDDLYVYPDPFANVIPQIGEGWTHYEFDIPSDFVGGPGELPAGWLGGSYDTGLDWFPQDRTFQEVMTNVRVVEFWWIHPAFWAILVPWDAGADNITIEYTNGPVPTETDSWGGVKALYR